MGGNFSLLKSLLTGGKFFSSKKIFLNEKEVSGAVGEKSVNGRIVTTGEMSQSFSVRKRL